MAKLTVTFVILLNLMTEGVLLAADLSPPAVHYLIKIQDLTAAEEITDTQSATNIMARWSAFKNEPCTAQFAELVDSTRGLIDGNLKNQFRKVLSKLPRAQLGIAFTINIFNDLGRLPNGDVNPNSFKCYLDLTAEELSGTGVYATITPLAFDRVNKVMLPPAKNFYDDKGSAANDSEFAGQAITNYLYPFVEEVLLRRPSAPYVLK